MLRTLPDVETPPSSGRSGHAPGQAPADPGCCDENCCDGSASGSCGCDSGCC